MDMIALLNPQYFPGYYSGKDENGNTYWQQRDGNGNTLWHWGATDEVIVPDNNLNNEINSPTDSKSNPPAVTLTSTARTIGFALRHAPTAWAIGEAKAGSSNLSTNCVRFSTQLGLNENSAHEGSEVNGYRHVLWQAATTVRFGSSIATQVGFAHEINPNALLNEEGNFQPMYTFNTLSEADETIDLLNNIIGRTIGAANPNASLNTLAQKTLTYFRENGVWVALRLPNNKYVIVQIKITVDRYNHAMEILKTLNEKGYSPADIESILLKQQAGDELQERLNREAAREPKF